MARVELARRHYLLREKPTMRGVRKSARPRAIYLVVGGVSCNSFSAIPHAPGTPLPAAKLASRLELSVSGSPYNMACAHIARTFIA